jgi:hypothetical protein
VRFGTIFSDKTQTIFSVAREESAFTSEALLASGPLLPGDELVRPTKEDLGRQVPAQFTAEGAGYFY